MKNSWMGWISLTNHYSFQMRVSEGHDGLGCSRPVSLGCPLPEWLAQLPGVGHHKGACPWQTLCLHGQAGRAVLTSVCSRCWCNPTLYREEMMSKGTCSLPGQDLTSWSHVTTNSKIWKKLGCSCIDYSCLQIVQYLVLMFVFLWPYIYCK